MAEYGDSSVNITEEVEKVRKAQLGVEVRESIANGLEKLSTYVQEKFASVQPLSEIESNLNTQAEEIKGVKEQAQTLLTNAQEYDTRITQTETDVDTLETKMTAAESKIASLTNGWVDLSSSCAHDNTKADWTHSLQIRKLEDHVYIRGCLAVQLPSAESGYPLLIATIPPAYRAKYTEYFIQPCMGKRVARLFTNANGELKIDWVANLSDGNVFTTATNTFTWVQFNVDYFID